MPEISIIVPIYKTELYLSECIESILLQTFSDFELLLIDDGSPDNCGKICDEYAAKDNRIKVFHKENGGVSSARNIGLDNAKGKYIGFVDSDDKIMPDMYKSLFACFGEDDIQLSFVSFNEKEVTKGQIVFFNRVSCTDFIFSNNSPFIWNKLFVSQIIGEQRFDESIGIGEDALFLAEYLCKIQRAEYIDSSLYYHRKTEESITRTAKWNDKIINIPRTNFMIYHKLYLQLGNVDSVLAWACEDTITWLNKVCDNQSICRLMNKEAKSLRIHAFKCKKINIKVRILFFAGYYGRGVVHNIMFPQKKTQRFDK